MRKSRISWKSIPTPLDNVIGEPFRSYTSYDGTLRLWDVAGRRQLAMLRGHSSVIESLAWSPDGNTIYTGSGDASCRIWHAPSWAEIEADEAP